jgi:hypothetical protein
MALFFQVRSLIDKATVVRGSREGSGARRLLTFWLGQDSKEATTGYLYVEINS